MYWIVEQAIDGMGKGGGEHFRVENVRCPEHDMLERVCFFETLCKNEFHHDGSSVRREDAMVGFLLFSGHVC